MADGLRRLDGVAHVEVDLQANVCAVTPAPDRLPDLAGLQAAVQQAGFRPGRAWITARGAFTTAGEQGFAIDASATKLRVRGPLPADATAPITARVDWSPEPVLVFDGTRPDH